MSPCRTSRCDVHRPGRQRDRDLAAREPRLGLFGRLGGLDVLRLGSRPILAVRLLDVMLVALALRQLSVGLGRGAILLGAPVLLGPLSLAPPTAPTGLGEVAEQLASDGGGLPGGAHPRSAQDLLALGSMR